MENWIYIVLGLAITTLDYLIVFIRIKSMFRAPYEKMFWDSRLCGIQLFYPKLDIRFNYLGLRIRMFRRTLVYLLFSGMYYFELFFLDICLFFIMFIALFKDLTNITKTKYQLAESPFTDKKEKGYFMFYPVFLTVHQFLLTMLLLINMLLLYL